jgi:hypothetical protein
VIGPLLIALLWSAPPSGDTTIVLGAVSRDVNGDTKPEVLTLTGVGRSVDSLDVTFSIEDAGRSLYRAKIVLPGRGTYERTLRSLLGLSYEAWLADVGRSFFASDKFKTPSMFLTEMRKSLPDHIRAIPMVIARDGGFPSDTARAGAIWHELEQAGATIFEFSAGGDSFTAIAWSPKDRRFYRLVECC